MFARSRQSLITQSETQSTLHWSIQHVMLCTTAAFQNLSCTCTLHHVAHQCVHQSAFAGALWPSDGDGLVVDTRGIDVSGGHKLTNTAFIELAIPGHNLRHLPLRRHDVCIYIAAGGAPPTLTRRQTSQGKLNALRRVCGHGRRRICNAHTDSGVALKSRHSKKLLDSEFIIILIRISPPGCTTSRWLRVTVALDRQRHIHHVVAV